MKTETHALSGHPCTTYGNWTDAEYILLQPTDNHDLEELASELAFIDAHTHRRYLFIALHVARWFDELAPWPAPPVFGKTPFGDGAGETLSRIERILRNLPGIPSPRIVLGGYSLAGLFALWAGYQRRFDGIVAASPSVWYKGWLPYAQSHQPLSKRFYLSLGDRETRSRTPILTTVGEAICRQHDLFSSSGLQTTLEWNAGNHFQDNGIRTAKGFVWAIGRSS